VKISRQLNASGFEECVRNDLPDVPIHFIMAGGFSLSHNEKPTIYDREEMCRINNNIKMKRWVELLSPLKYGKFSIVQIRVILFRKTILKLLF